MTEPTTNTFCAVLLGFVEGLTEYIPVSSTGHLIIVGHSIRFVGPKSAAFEVFIQLGAILAVVVLYRRRFIALLDFSMEHDERSFVGTSALLKLGLTTLPALIVGKLFHEQITELLFSPLPVAVALIAGGIAMILLDKPHRQIKVQTIEEISYRSSFVLGLFQCLALWPGMSRSGSMIIGGLLLGLRRHAAAEYSFLAAVPVMCAASAFSLWKTRSLLAYDDIALFGIGFLVSFVTAMAAIRFFILVLDRFTLRPFGIYRIIIGLLVIALEATVGLGI